MRSPCQTPAFIEASPEPPNGELDRPAIGGKFTRDPRNCAVETLTFIALESAPERTGVRGGRRGIRPPKPLAPVSFRALAGGDVCLGAGLSRPGNIDGPSCLVLDVQLPGLDGLELQQALADRKEQIVFITGHGDVPMCTQAMKAGAVDFLIKPVDDKALLAAVRRALERSAEIRRMKAERASARAKLDRLTPREFEVLQRVIAGLLNKQIAAELGSAEKTVKIHRGRVMEKMGVASVPELVRLAQAAGVAPLVSRA